MSFSLRLSQRMWWLTFAEAEPAAKMEIKEVSRVPGNIAVAEEVSNARIQWKRNHQHCCSKILGFNCFFSVAQGRTVLIVAGSHPAKTHELYLTSNFPMSPCQTWTDVIHTTSHWENNPVERKRTPPACVMAHET